MTAVTTKIAKMVRLLGSDRPGEVMGAVQALRRTLAGADLDLHDLAIVVERGLPAAIAASSMEPERPEWVELADYCMGMALRMSIETVTPRDLDFLDNIRRRVTEPTPKQRVWLEGIHERVRQWVTP